MNDWINLGALWRIVVIGLVCGAGLPALFAVGLKAVAAAEGDTTTPDGGGTAAVRGNPVLLAGAGLCFAVVLAAIGWGIYLIVSAS
ncbi:hypothetical protein [Jatrophihabitans endophyticus]|uniref:hypothetical protein n=1 Tax=Jatrophihabitans endophyticus TaxID=1206085 RepID=UPI0019E6DB8F|nr:hypothetical protein [Jatrophihabitans endophyticus]MBE7188935.1 hypothetical protein [Jatrophihabitans endophyticus]